MKRGVNIGILCIAACSAGVYAQLQPSDGAAQEAVDNTARSEPAFFTGGWDSERLSLAWDWSVSAETSQGNRGLYQLSRAQGRTDRVNALLDVEVGYEEWRGLLALKSDNLYSDSSSGDTEPIHSELVLQELFWQTEMAIADEVLDLTLGKVRLDWGVGYGYRPLNVLNSYRRNPVGIQVEEGVGLASLSRFDEQGEWTLFYSNSSLTEQAINEFERRSQQQGIGLKRYGLAGEHEIQWLIYRDNVRQGLLGASLVSVLDGAWEVHLSSTYQHRYLQYQLMPIDQPVRLAERQGAVQALAGLNWANEAGHNLLFEYWYDGRAWSKQQWTQAHEATGQLRSLAAVTGDAKLDDLRQSYSQGLQQENLVQHNLMLHWQLDSSAWSRWSCCQSLDWLQPMTPRLDVVYSPTDRGVIVTPRLDYLWLDTGSSRVEFELAARFFTGDDQSVYANLPNKHMLLLMIKGRF